MRSMGDFGRFVTAIAAGLTVVAGGAAGYPAYAQATQQSGPAAGAMTVRQLSARAAITLATRPVPDFGNPGGHAHVPPAARAVSTAHPNHVIGSGTPASCTSAAVVRAVAKGGIITFNCGAESGHHRDDRHREGGEHQSPDRDRRRRSGHAEWRRQAPDPVHEHLRQEADVDHQQLLGAAVATAHRAEHRRSRMPTRALARPRLPTTAAAPSSTRAASSRS